MYQNYADRRLLAEHFDAARQWVDFIESKKPNLLWESARGNDYNDWLNADTLIFEGWPKLGGAIPQEVFATAFFAHSTELVAKKSRATRRLDTHWLSISTCCRMRYATRRSRACWMVLRGTAVTCRPEFNRLTGCYSS